MLSLDPKWLSVELEAIQQDKDGWGTVLNGSYEIAVQRVFAYQAKHSSEPDRESDRELAQR